ncbi:hypothetical protein CCP2SC5_200022 [Azospirillaceae bacterium]
MTLIASFRAYFEDDANISGWCFLWSRALLIGECGLDDRVSLWFIVVWLFADLSL